MVRILTFVSIAFVGMALAATPASASAGNQELDCPAMPTTNDDQHSKEGGLALSIAGFTADGKRSRSHVAGDVMMREGGFAAWSAAVIFAQACQANRIVYRDNPSRQRDELIQLRDRLVLDQRVDAEHRVQRPGIVTVGSSPAKNTMPGDGVNPLFGPIVTVSPEKNKFTNSGAEKFFRLSKSEMDAASAHQAAGKFFRVSKSEADAASARQAAETLFGVICNASGCK